jgi:hypothetical protein
VRVAIFCIVLRGNGRHAMTTGSNRLIRPGHSLFKNSTRNPGQEVSLSPFVWIVLSIFLLSFPSSASAQCLRRQLQGSLKILLGEQNEASWDRTSLVEEPNDFSIYTGGRELWQLARFAGTRTTQG